MDLNENVPQSIIDEARRLNFIQDRIESRLFRCADSESLLFYNGNGLFSVVEDKENLGKIIHKYTPA